MSYLAWKVVHVAAVVLFLGNITTGVFWAAHAHRSGDMTLIARTMDGVIRSDRWFTIPGVIGIIISGVAMAMSAGYPLLGTGWIVWSLGLFTVSGLVFQFFLAPLQRQIFAAASASDQARYELLFRRWGFWGLIALITPVAAMALMVLKPTLPAF